MSQTIIADYNGQQLRIKLNAQVSISKILPPVSSEWGQLHGVNWKSSVLSRKENSPNPPENGIESNEINKFMDICANANWNLIRLVVYQETYKGHRAAFFTEMKAIIEAADQRGIAVIIDNHQWKMGGGEYNDSLGFPKAYFAGYNISPAIPYEPNGQPEIIEWWRDLYSDNLRQFPNAHQDMANYFDDMIDQVDGYENLLGYEILNEPQTTRPEDYTNMGNMNTFIAQRIRARSNKRILYCRDNTLAYGGSQTLKPELIPNIASGIVYDNHSYSLRRMKSTYQPQTLVNIDNRTDIEVLVGEWAAQIQFDKPDDPPGNPGNILTLDNTKWILNFCKDNNYAICWWALGQFALSDSARQWKCLTRADGTLRAEGLIYKQAISEVYA